MPKHTVKESIKIRRLARKLYETGLYTQEQICTIIKRKGGMLTRTTLVKWATGDPDDIWQKNGEINETLKGKRSKTRIQIPQDKEQVKLKNIESLVPIVEKAIEEGMLEGKKEAEQEIIQLQNSSSTANKTHFEAQDKTTQGESQKRILTQEISKTPEQPAQRPNTAEPNNVMQQVIETQKRNKEKISTMARAIIGDFLGDQKNISEVIQEIGLLGLYRIQEILVQNKAYFKNAPETTGLQLSVHYLRLAQAFETYAVALGYSQQQGINFFQQNNISNNSEGQENLNTIPTINFIPHKE